MNRNRNRSEQKSLVEGHTFSVPSITGNPFTPELVSAVHSLPSLQASLGEITDSLRTIRNLTEEISDIKKDLWEEDGFDYRIKLIAEQQVDGEDELQQLRQENRSLREDVNMLKSIVINLERTVIKNQNEIIDLKSRSMKQNILIHNLPEEDGENLFVKIPELIKTHFKVDTSFANIHRNKNRKKLLELNNKYWKANVKTRIVGEKLVFPNGSIHRDKVQKPKAEQILGMDQAEREALKKIKVTELETNEGGNIFRGMGATTECYNQVRDMYKKTFCDQSHAKADHNILVYRFRDSSGQTHEGYNDDVVASQNAKNDVDQNYVVSAAESRYNGFRRLNVLHMAALMPLQHIGYF
ncbi:uncharacterized protein LOC133189225 [Saccostrea echinata]|uniref:uncharacterized protein LOC133189225 n=1 Tax=Saccostrea echinata TaxID=191078 RepID=UPI002A830EF5|nr:uncharacterized protein LOC133189225 [Saccostrea echinata]